MSPHALPFQWWMQRRRFVVCVVVRADREAVPRRRAGDAGERRQRARHAARGLRDVHLRPRLVGPALDGGLVVVGRLAVADREAPDGGDARDAGELGGGGRAGVLHDRPDRRRAGRGRDGDRERDRCEHRRRRLHLACPRARIRPSGYARIPLQSKGRSRERNGPIGTPGLRLSARGSGSSGGRSRGCSSPSLRTGRSCPR